MEANELHSEKRRRGVTYDLLMAVDHLLEGTQLYAKAAQDAISVGDEALAEFFGNLERTSRHQADLARKLLEQAGVRKHIRPSG